MLFEKRTYTLRPGATEAFWKAQEVRGFEIVRPILDRLVGYFWTPAGPCEQIVHLYRFDSYDDWVHRLHGLYGVPELEPYFRAVRPLMLAQQNEFLAPAPLDALTPFWGGGRDVAVVGALSADVPPLATVVIEENITQLLPGQLPAYWEAWKVHGLLAGDAATRRLIGVFTTSVGSQHLVTSYRWHPSRSDRDVHEDELASHPQWQVFRETTSESIASYETKLMSPAPFTQMSPLFAKEGHSLFATTATSRT